MSKPATQNYVAYGRVATWGGIVVLAAGLLAGCSSGDYGASSGDPGASPLVGKAEPATMAGVAPIALARDAGRSGAPVTGADGYPNVNVDTANPLRTPARTAQERDVLEADLLALGARQRSSADVTKPQSVIQELQDLGRRSKADAEKQIESGAAPATP